MRKLKDYYFATFAFPLAMDVAILYWSLFVIDRKAVLPDEIESFFPAWLNQILHTLVAITIVLEMIILHREYPTRKLGIFGLMTFMFSYLAWLCLVRYAAGKWAYPIIDSLDLPAQIGFFVFTMIFPILMYLCGEWLNGKIWSEERISSNKVKSGIV